MSEHSGCKLCGAIIDSWRHALFYCTMSRCVWTLVDEDLIDHIAATEINNPKMWLFFMQETLSAKEFQKLLIICWAIWRARRMALHEDIFQSPLSIFSFITKYLDDLKLAGLIEDIDMTKSTRNKKSAPKWIPPPEAFVKFNVDAAVARAEDKGTVSVVCRDNVGNYVAASAMVIDGLTDPSSLEALACNEAISLAMDIGVRKCVIASDCLEVILNLQKQSLCAYSSVLKEIKARSTLFQEVVFKHEGRESNCEAHALAKSVCKLAPGRYLWLLGRPEIPHVPQNIMN